MIDKKIIAFDLDGTLAESKSPITPEMAGLVKELIKHKIVVITSGGKFEQFQKQLLPLFDNEFLLEWSGNLILLPTSASQKYEFDKTHKDWALTEKHALPDEIKAKAMKLLQDIIVSGEYEIPPNPTGEIIEDRDTQLTFSALGQQALIEAKKIWDPDQKKRLRIREVIAPLLPEASILINAYSSIDILKKDMHKGTGLQMLLDKMGLEKKDMVYVGDGLFPGGNDYAVYEAGIETIPVTGPQQTAELIKGWIHSRA